MIRLTSRILLWLAVGVLVTVLLFRFTGFKFPEIDFFKSAPKEIMTSALVVEEVRKVGLLISQTFYDEILQEWETKEAQPSLMDRYLRGKDKTQVLLVRGKVLAGIDLSDFNAVDVENNRDSLVLKLPAPRILQIEINPAKVEIIKDAGLSQQGINQMLKLAEVKLKANAISAGILIASRRQAEITMKNLFTAFGYKKVHIIWN